MKLHFGDFFFSSPSVASRESRRWIILIPTHSLEEHTKAAFNLINWKLLDSRKVEAKKSKKKKSRSRFSWLSSIFPRDRIKKGSRLSPVSAFSTVHFSLIFRGYLSGALIGSPSASVFFFRECDRDLTTSTRTYLHTRERPKKAKPDGRTDSNVGVAS